MDGFTGIKTATTEELPDATAVMDPFRDLTHYIARSLLEAGGFRTRLHPQIG